MGSIVEEDGRFNIKSIAVIGSGPAGLAVAKYLLAESAFQTIDIYEQQAEVGGIWHYTPNKAQAVSVPQTTPHVNPDAPFSNGSGAAPVFSNPMYDELHTNIPKNLMQYSDQDFPTDSLLYPTRQDVQKYLMKYSEGLRHLIMFSTQVEHVSSSISNSRIKWNLVAKSTITEEKLLKEYDAIVVANGHYSVPFIPSVQGIEVFHTSYPSIISHSKIYRSPHRFSNKKVIIVGNAASGLDIGTQISRVCKKPLLNSVHRSSLIQSSREDKEDVPAIVEYIVKDRAVRFEDGRLEKDIDAIIYCTGYLYSYPFLKSINPPFVTTGRRVVGLWQHLFSISHPTIAFVALPQKIIPFPLSEAQGAAIAKVWSNKLDLPSRTEMKVWEDARVDKLGDCTGFHVFGFPHDAEYINHFHDWISTADPQFGKRPPFWDEKSCWLREIYADIRKKFVDSGGTAKCIEELGFDFEKQGLSKWP